MFDSHPSPELFKVLSSHLELVDLAGHYLNEVLAAYKKLEKLV